MYDISDTNLHIRANGRILDQYVDIYVHADLKFYNFRNRQKILSWQPIPFQAK